MKLEYLCTHNSSPLSSHTHTESLVIVTHCCKQKLFSTDTVNAMQVCGVHFSSQTEKKKQNRDVRKDRKEQWNGEQSECMTEQSEKNAKKQSEQKRWNRKCTMSSVSLFLRLLESPALCFFISALLNLLLPLTVKLKVWLALRAKLKCFLLTWGLEIRWMLSVCLVFLVIWWSDNQWLTPQLLFCFCTCSVNELLFHFLLWTRSHAVT